MIGVEFHLCFDQRENTNMQMARFAQVAFSILTYAGDGVYQGCAFVLILIFFIYQSTVIDDPTCHFPIKSSFTVEMHLHNHQQPYDQNMINNRVLCTDHIHITICYGTACYDIKRQSNRFDVLSTFYAWDTTFVNACIIMSLLS